MNCAIHRRQDTERLEPIDLSQPLLPYEEPDLCNDFISKEPDYIDRFCINFPRHYVLRHVLLDSDQLNGFMEGSCPTNQETKECRPTQIDTKENNKQKENTPEE